MANFKAILATVLVSGVSISGTAMAAAPKTTDKPAAAPAATCEAKSTPGAFDFAVTDVEGKPANLSAYKGKVALIVNTASKCGYTGQYRDLQALFEKYKDKGFVILGFPSNDFGGQEPGSNKEIKTFCEVNFNVKFPLFDKAPVKGDKKQPLYKFLTEQSGDSYKGEVSWNFEKFLVDKDGHVIGRYKSKVKPMDADITKTLEQALATPATCG